MTTTKILLLRSIPAVLVFLLWSGLSWAQYSGPALAPLPRDPDEELAAASVRFVCNVAGAQLYVDGVYIGKIPLAGPVELGAGEHDVQVSAEGYSTAQVEIQVKPGAELEVDIQLAAAAAEPEEPEEPEGSTGDFAMHARRTATAGFVFVGLHFATMLLVPLGLAGDTGEYLMIAGGITSSVMCIIDTPLLLVASSLADRAMGVAGGDSTRSAAWSMYGISVGFIPLHVGIGIASVFSSGGIAVIGAMSAVGGLLYLVTRITSLVVGARAMRTIRKEHSGAQIGVMPYVAPGAGGASFGLAGQF